MNILHLEGPLDRRSKTLHEIKEYNSFMRSIYADQSFIKLVDLLNKLEVIGLRFHNISHIMSLISPNGNIMVQPDWIPLAIVDTSAHYVEIIPHKRHIWT